MVSLFSQQILGVLMTIKNLNVLVNDTTFSPPLEALPQAILDEPLYQDFEVDCYMGLVGIPVGSMAESFKYVSAQIEAIRSNCHERIERAPADQHKQLDLELNVLAYRMETIAADSELNLCKA